MSKDEMDQIFDEDDVEFLEQAEQVIGDSEKPVGFVDGGMSRAQHRATMQAESILSLAKNIYTHTRGINANSAVERARTFMDNPEVERLHRVAHPWLFGTDD